MQSAPRRALDINPLRQEIIFGGEKGAQTVPKGAGPGLPVEKAKELEQSGASAPEIFQQTGWYHGPDGTWKWTLSDKGADFNPNAVQAYKSGDPMGLTKKEIEAIPDSVRLKGNESRKLSEVLNHPNLYETYPALKNTTVTRLPPEIARMGTLADYDPTTNTMRIGDDRPKNQVLSAMLHELQHGVQKEEGFGVGGAPELFYSRADIQSAPPDVAAVIKAQAQQNYERLAGETEARQVQKQFEAQNWSQLPTRMEGFPAPEQQWVRQGNATNLPPGKSYQFTPVDHDPFTTTPVDYDPFKMKPVDHDPFAPATNPYEQALHDYPILRDQGIVGGPGKASQRLEFWPANEPGAPDRPRPDFIPFDKPGVELGTGDVRSIDVLGDVVSHHMVQKDPVIKRYYERFAESLTPEQQQRLQEQYQYAQQNENETRPYEQWEEKSGMPAYFRGYAFQQWPDEVNQQAYTPEQRGHFDRMMTYLQGPQESPTPY